MDFKFNKIEATDYLYNIIVKVDRFNFMALPATVKP